MGSITLQGTQYPARDELLDAIEQAWQRLASAGTWWSAGQRLAIAAEVRAAKTCEYCARRKEALSPYAIKGEHSRSADCDAGLLPDAAVDAVHRIVTDRSRLTESWVRQLVGDNSGASTGDSVTDSISEECYVEIVSIVAITIALDIFDIALGRQLTTLPSPLPGEPARHRPAAAKRDLAWVSTLAPEDVQAGDPNPFPVHGQLNIHRAMSLVPQEVSNFFDLDVELYLKDHEIRDFEHEFREISHAQIELIAGRASALNRCYY